MKKISLVLLASMFSLGVFAQTTPAASKTTAAPTAKKDNTVVKSHSKKSTPTKKVTHHTTGANKVNSTMDTKDGGNMPSKK